MKFGPLPVDQAAGCVLAHSLALGRRRLAKGRLLTADDVEQARAAGHGSLVVARLEPGDVPEDVAADRLARAVAGPGLLVLAPVHGRVNLAAAADGLLCLPPGMVAAVNAVDEAITLATLALHTRAARGDIVATIKTIRYAVAETVLHRAIAAAQPAALAPFRAINAALIATTLDGTTAKALARLAQVTMARTASLGAALAVAPTCPHNVHALAAGLAASTADLLLVAGASGALDRGDVIPAAIVAAGGTVERLGMPVDPGNLLVLGRIGARPVIGLPGCARSPKRNGFDLVLERLVAGIAVDSAAIAAMGEGGLLAEAERPQPRQTRAAVPARVGAVVLAAGRGSRMAATTGDGHKLLMRWQGRPIISHIVDAISAAGLPPPLVVLGHRAAAVRAALDGRAAQFVTPADWADGMGRSLAAGIAAVPPDWDAVLLCLADMPRIEPALIAALAAAAGDVVVPVWQGRRGHPVRWPRRAFADLMALSGDSGGRALMHRWHVTEVAAPSDAVIDDIDTPAALAALLKR